MLYIVHIFAQPIIYYTILGIVSLLIVYTVGYRLLYRTGFWGRQPMRRTFGLLDRIRQDGVIDSEPPKWNKYCDERHVTTTDKTTNEVLTKISNLANKTESLDDGLVKHVDANLLRSSFNGFLSPVYVSYYTEGSTEYGCLTSRPLKLRVGKNEFNTYYLDFFHTSPGLGPSREVAESSLLQTHEFYQRSNNPDIQVTLFLRQTKLSRVLELCSFNTYTYEIDLDLDFDGSRQKRFNVFLARSNDHLMDLIEFVKTRQKDFHVDITTTMGNMLTLIESELLYVVGCRLLDNTLGYIFFRDFKNGTKKDPILDCISSVFDNTLDSELCIQACFASFTRGLMLSTKKTPCRYLRLWDLADNNIISGLLKRKRNYRSKNRQYVYLYNYRTDTVCGNKVLMLI